MAALLAVAFASGALVGAGGAVVVIQKTVRQAIQRPELRTRHAARMLTRKLSLDASQQERVRRVLEEQSAEFERLRQEVWPRVITRLERTEREVDATLDTKQRERWKRLAERLKKRWLSSYPPAGTPPR